MLSKLLPGQPALVSPEVAWFNLIGLSVPALVAWVCRNFVAASGSEPCSSVWIR